MKKEKYVLDACGIFLFFQLIKPTQTYSNLKPSKKVKQLYYKFLMKQIMIGIPILAIWEFVYKFWKNKPEELILVKEIINEFEKSENIEIISVDFQIGKKMLQFYESTSYHQLFRKCKKNATNMDFFDFFIYLMADSNEYVAIISKDEVFDTVYPIPRIW